MKKNYYEIIAKKLKIFHETKLNTKYRESLRIRMLACNRKKNVFLIGGFLIYERHRNLASKRVKYFLKRNIQLMQRIFTNCLTPFVQLEME